VERNQSWFCPISNFVQRDLDSHLGGTSVLFWTPQHQVVCINSTSDSSWQFFDDIVYEDEEKSWLKHSSLGENLFQ
jgi:hypothetical protein